jgi:hypothetical protein
VIPGARNNVRPLLFVFGGGVIKEMTKQFLILKVVKDLTSGVADLVPFLGLVTQEAAEQIVTKAMNQDPATQYVIQEVGAA